MQILHLSVFVLVSNKQCLLYIRTMILLWISERCMSTARVALTQVAPGVCVTPATAMPAGSGHCESACVSTEGRDPAC